MKYLLLLGLVGVILSCKKENNNTFIPQKFPSHSQIKGFNFPEDSTMIYGWLEEQDTVSITKHAWGLWNGLTSMTDQTYDNKRLMVFETWMGVQELAIMSSHGQVTGQDKLYNRSKLTKPRQFDHDNFLRQKIDSSFLVIQTVSYDPTSAYFATSNKLFNSSSYEKYKKPNKIGRIPHFPNTSIVLKPSYYAGISDKNGLIRVPVWEEPSTVGTYNYTNWGSFVYCNINNTEDPNKNIIPVTTKNPTQKQIKDATCNLDKFINHRIDRIGADYLNSHLNINTPESGMFEQGDYILLVALHVTTKEISNWTWQTFFWCPNPSNPPFPSSKFVSDLRPSEIKGPAANYALSTSYAMVWPNQPITGGTSIKARPIISFNPYLEAQFSPSTFGKNTFRPNFRYGMQTNCMSCHAISTLSAKNRYNTDQYIDMNDTTYFKNDVQLDFLFSIQGNLNKK